jgi:hypothetical protein
VHLDDGSLFLDGQSPVFSCHLKGSE